MTPQHTARRWLTVCLGIFLGVLSVNAAAVDPGIVKGKLTHKGKVYSLQHVYAWQPPGRGEELWVYVTDAELPAAAAQDRSEPGKLADADRFRGVKLIIHPTKPDLGSVNMVLYAPGEGGTYGNSPKWQWQRLRVGNKRVAGKLQYEYSSHEVSLDVEFSAPVFGPPGGGQASASTKTPGGGQTGAGTKTLTGAQAQKSPQADVFLAYEKAMLWQGIDAAGAHMTPERLTAMQGMLKQYGDEFKQMQTEKRKSTPQSEARRKQIEKVVVDGDSAVLEVRNGPNDVDQVPLAKTKDGWKVTTR